MDARSKIFPVLVIAAAILLVGNKAGWFGRRQRIPAAAEQGIAPEAADSGSTRPVRSGRTSLRKTNEGPIASGPVLLSQESVDANRKMQEILGAAMDNSQKAQELLALLPQLAASAREEAAQHAANLLPDETFAVVHRVLTNAQTSELVLDVLIGDLLDRPDAIKLPLLLEIIRTPEHPKDGEAREILELYLENDFGADWDSWQKAIDAWLKDNPD
jgi:hypothetical protein